MAGNAAGGGEVKDYKRLTQYMQVGNNIVAIQPQRKERIQLYIDRLFELEDKIENGELCDRKETAREILKPLYNVIMEHSDCCVNLSEDIKFLMEKYGVDLEDEE